MNAACEIECCEIVRAEVAKINPDVQVSVTTVRPAVISHWTDTMTCPHGVTVYLEPTQIQHLRWLDEGTP